MVPSFENVRLTFTFALLINTCFGQYVTYYNYPRAPYNRYIYPSRQQNYYYPQNQQIVPTYYHTRNTPNSYYFNDNENNNLALQNTATLQQLDNSAKLKLSQLINQNMFKIPNERIIYYNKEPNLKTILNIEPYKIAKDKMDGKELISKKNRLKSNDEYYEFDDYVEDNNNDSDDNDQVIINVKLITTNDNTKDSNKKQKTGNNYNKNKVNYKSKEKEVKEVTTKIPNNETLDAIVNKIAKILNFTKTKTDIIENKHTDIDKIDKSNINGTSNDIYYDELNTNIDDGKESEIAFLVKAIDGRLIMSMQSYIEFLNNSKNTGTYTEGEEITNYLKNNWHVNSSLTTMVNYILDQESINSKIKNLVKFIKDAKEPMFYKYLVSRLYHIALKAEPNVEDFYFLNWAIYFYDAVQQIINENPRTATEPDLEHISPPVLTRFFEREPSAILYDMTNHGKKLQLNKYNDVVVFPMFSNEYLKKQTNVPNENSLRTLLQDELEDEINSYINESRDNKTLEVKKQSVRSVSPTMPVDVASEAKDVENYSISEINTEQINNLPESNASSTTESQLSHTDITVNSLNASSAKGQYNYSENISYTFSNFSLQPSITKDIYSYFRPSTGGQVDSSEKIFHDKDELPENNAYSANNVTKLSNTTATFEYFGTSDLGPVNSLEIVTRTEEYGAIDISSQHSNIADTIDYLRAPPDKPQVHSSENNSILGEARVKIEQHLTNDFPSSNQYQSIADQTKIPPTLNPVLIDMKPRSDQYAKVCFTMKISNIQNLLQNNLEGSDGRLEMPLDKHKSKQYNYPPSYLDNPQYTELPRQYEIAMPVTDGRQIFDGDNHKTGRYNYYPFYFNDYKDTVNYGRQISGVDKLKSKEYYYYPFYLDKYKDTEPLQKYETAKPVNDGSQLSGVVMLKSKEYHYYPFYIDKNKDTEPFHQYDITKSVNDGSKLLGENKLKSKENPFIYPKKQIRELMTSTYYHQPNLFEFNLGDNSSPYIYYPKLSTNNDLKKTSLKEKLLKSQPLKSSNLKEYTSKTYDYLQKRSDLLQNRPNYKSHPKENIDDKYQMNQTRNDHLTKNYIPYDQSLIHNYYNSLSVLPITSKFSGSNVNLIISSEEVTKEKHNELSDSNDISNLYKDNLDNQPCGSSINSTYKCYRQRHYDNLIKNAERSKHNPDSEEHIEVLVNQNIPEIDINNDAKGKHNQVISVDLIKKLIFTNDGSTDFIRLHKINEEDKFNPYDELLKTEVVVDGQYPKPYKNIDTFGKPSLVKHANANIYIEISSPYRDINSDKTSQWHHKTMDDIENDVFIQTNDNQNDKLLKLEVVTDIPSSKPYEEMSFDKSRIIKNENKNFNDNLSLLSTLYSDIENADKLLEGRPKAIDDIDDDVSFEIKNNQNDDLLIKEITESQNLKPYESNVIFDKPSKDKNDNDYDGILQYDGLEEDKITPWDHKANDVIDDNVTFELKNNQNGNILREDTITKTQNFKPYEDHVTLDKPNSVKNENVNTLDQIALYGGIENTENSTDYEEMLPINESGSEELLINYENELINNLNKSLDINNAFNQLNGSKIANELIILDGSNIKLNEKNKTFDFNDDYGKNTLSINSDNNTLLTTLKSPNMNISNYQNVSDYYFDDSSYDLKIFNPKSSEIIVKDDKYTNSDAYLKEDIHEINGFSHENSYEKDKNSNDGRLINDEIDYPAQVLREYSELIIANDTFNKSDGFFKDNSHTTNKIHSKEISSEEQLYVNLNDDGRESNFKLENTYDEINNTVDDGILLEDNFNNAENVTSKYSKVIIVGDVFENPYGALPDGRNETMNDDIDENINETLKKNGETVKSEQNIIVHGPDELYDAEGSIDIPKDYRHEETDTQKNTNVTVMSTQLRRFLAKFHDCFGFYPEFYSHGKIIGLNFDKHNLLNHFPDVYTDDETE